MEVARTALGSMPDAFGAVTSVGDRVIFSCMMHGRSVLCMGTVEEVSAFESSTGKVAAVRRDGDDPEVWDDVYRLRSVAFQRTAWGHVTEPPWRKSCATATRTVLLLGRFEHSNVDASHLSDNLCLLEYLEGYAEGGGDVIELIERFAQLFGNIALGRDLRPFAIGVAAAHLAKGRELNSPAAIAKLRLKLMAKVEDMSRAARDARAVKLATAQVRET